MGMVLPVVPAFPAVTYKNAARVDMRVVVQF